MPSWTRGLLAFALAAAGAWVALPGEARAQDFPCNGTPGEYVVGFSGAGGGVNTSGQGTPICRAPASAPNRGAAEPPPRGVPVYVPMPGDGSRTVDSYIALASHRDGKDYWVTWNQRSAEVAERIVLEACTATLGEGCQIDKSGGNGSVVIGQDPEGGMWIASSATDERTAIGILERNCPTCQVVKRYTSSPWREAAYILPSDHAAIDARQTRQGYDFPAFSRVPPPRPAAQ